MSKIIFQSSYILVVPSYAETEYHKHSMLHMFVGKEDSYIEIDGHRYFGNVIFIKENVIHKIPEGSNNFFLLIDPTSYVAECIYDRYLNSLNGYGMCVNIALPDMNKQTDEEILSFTEKMMAKLFISDTNKRIQDERIEELLCAISSYQYLDKRVTEIAKEINYSESWLVHLFKRETGLSLKNYLLIKRLEYVWKKVMEGKTITESAIQAGFSSPSHFAASCKQMTGISVSKVLK